MTIAAITALLLICNYFVCVQKEMLSLASIDSGGSDSSGDEMEIDSLILDADGNAVGETRRLRPPLANADYRTGESNIRLIKTIGYDPHVTKPQRETAAVTPGSDMYDSVSESYAVSSRVATNISERVSHNRTGELPPLPDQDTPRPTYMQGFHDMRSVDERGVRLPSTRRSITETAVRDESRAGHVGSAAASALRGVYDKLTRGFRVDKVSPVLSLPGAHEDNRIKVVSALREYDPSRGKSTSILSVPQPDAAVTDKFRVNQVNDSVALERTSLILPVAGYGRISIDGEWNSHRSSHDRLEHELIEVDVAEMELLRGELHLCSAHPSRATGYDGLVRSTTNIAPEELRHGRVHVEYGPVNSSRADGLVRAGLNLSSHEKRFGCVHSASAGISQSAVNDGLERQGVDISLHTQRLGRSQHAAAGPVHPTSAWSDGLVRAHVNTASHEQSFGRVYVPSAGPLKPTNDGYDAISHVPLDISSRTQRQGLMEAGSVGPLVPSGLDGLQRNVVDVSAHNTRYGRAEHADIGPLNPGAIDGVFRPELDVAAYEKRLGEEQRGAAGPLCPVGFDALVRPQLDVTSHLQRNGGSRAAFAHPVQFGAGAFDGSGLSRKENDISLYSREIGRVDMNGPLVHTSLNLTEGRASRQSPLNTSELSRDMTLSFAYDGALRSSVDTDRGALRREELHFGVPACGVHSSTTAAPAFATCDADEMRLPGRAEYECTGGSGGAGYGTDLSWVSCPVGDVAPVREQSRCKAPDSLSVIAMPGDDRQTSVLNMAVSARDTRTKHNFASIPSSSRPLVQHQQMPGAKLPVIYESRRRVPMAVEVQPQPPVSEFLSPLSGRDVPHWHSPDDESSE